MSVDYVSEVAYAIMISTAYRIATLDANGETQAAADEYKQHIGAMDASAIQEFNRMLAVAGATLQDVKAAQS